MTLPSMSKKFRDKENRNGEAKDVKSLRFDDAQPASVWGQYTEDTLKTILVYVVVIVALTSFVIKFWAPIERTLSYLL